MSEFSISAEYKALILRYLSKQATDAEMHQLEQWVAEKEENMAFFKGEKRAWMLAGALNDKRKVDVESAWAQTEKKLFDQAKVVTLDKKKASTSSRRNWLGIAATLALLAAVGIWLFVGAGSGAEQFAAQEQLLQQNLSDGSVVSLNKYSSLAFDPKAAGNIRQAKLTGDAFFDVARNENRPFVIEAKAVQVKVLGTAFYVDARKELDQVQVIVQSGSVSVEVASQKVILAPGESAIYNETSKQLTKQKNTDNNFLAWTNKTLEFEEASLEEVVFALNRQFHTSIRLDNPALRNCKLTARYVDKSLDAVLTIIEKSLGIEIESQGEDYVVSGTCVE